jgi:hypothetical protein
MRDQASGAEQREFLLAASAWQETLLQSYRSLHVSIQGFLMAASAAIFAVQLTGVVQHQGGQPLVGAVINVAFTALLACVYWLQRETASELQGVVASRAADIDHWHMRTMLAENELEPMQRAFTYFKMWQHGQRADVTHLLPTYLPDDGISEQKAEELIRKGQRHTRDVLDVNLFARLRLLAQGILVASALTAAWFVYQWWMLRTV